MKEGRCFKCKQQGTCPETVPRGITPDDETIDSEEEDGGTETAIIFEPW